MNIAITDNPYVDESTVISSRGVMTDAKIAKLNNKTKRPVLVANWEKGRPVINVVSANVEETKVENRDYDSLLDNIGIKALQYSQSVNSTGAKKLRVNKIVISKTKTIYNVVNKEEIREIEEVKEVKEIRPIEENRELVNQINALSMPGVSEAKREDVHGRHEHTGEVPVDDIKEAIRNEVNQRIPTISRMERNALEHENVAKIDEAPKAGDIDLYNNLLHSDKDDDVSRQLQGAREELSIEKEESKKLAEQYGKAVRELEELKSDLENRRRMKAQQEKRELTETLNNIETLKRENLERTSDLSSIQAEIAKLKAEKEAMESSIYQDSPRSFGRRSA